MLLIMIQLLSDCWRKNGQKHGASACHSYVWWNIRWGTCAPERERETPPATERRESGNPAYLISFAANGWQAIMEKISGTTAALLCGCWIKWIATPSRIFYSPHFLSPLVSLSLVHSCGIDVIPDRIFIDQKHSSCTWISSRNDFSQGTFPLLLKTATALTTRCLIVFDGRAVKNDIIWNVAGDDVKSCQPFTLSLLHSPRHLVFKKLSQEKKSLEYKSSLYYETDEMDGQRTKRRRKKRSVLNKRWNRLEKFITSTPKNDVALPPPLTTCLNK